MRQLLLIGFLLLGPQTWAAGQLNLCKIDTDAAPWMLKDGVGLNNVLLSMVEKKLAMRFDIEALPWKRCLAAIAAGTKDGALSASFNAERNGFALFPMQADGKTPDANRRIMFESYSLYRRKGDPLSWDGSKLTGMKPGGFVAIQLGYSISKDLQQMGVPYEESEKSVAPLLRKLEHKLVDAVATLTNDGDSGITALRLQGVIERIEPPLVRKPYFLIFSRAAKLPTELPGRVWAALEEARESPEYLTTVRQHGYLGTP